jgi:hypothetical protein
MANSKAQMAKLDELLFEFCYVSFIPVPGRPRACPGMNGLSGTGILPASGDTLPPTSHPEDVQHRWGCPPATPDSRHGGQGIPNKR